MSVATVQLGAMANCCAVEQAQHVACAPRFTGDIDILGSGLLQRQADEFAAPLDPGPVIELVPHGAAPRSARAPVVAADQTETVADLRPDVLGHRRRTARRLPFRAIDHAGRSEM